MSQNPLKQKDQTNIRPNILQNQASDPDSSVWVSASAGSGKTKVLTDRILRLLLPNQKNMGACPPHKILALTFTKAGASEMSLRIHNRLSEWATMPLDDEDGLQNNLQNLLGYPPTQQQIAAARKLFASVVDTPGGLKIMTIHSFCQSVLGRFPLEANLSPGFQALEEDQAKTLLQQAQKLVFKKASEDKGSPLSEALYNVMLVQNEEQFSNLIQKLMSERKQLQKILEKNFNTEGLYNALCAQLKIRAGQTEEELIYSSCSNTSFDEKSLWEACKNLADGTKKDIEKSIIIQSWLEKNQKDRAQNFDVYKRAYIKSKDEGIFEKLANKKVIDNYPNTLKSLEIESHRVFNLINKKQSIKIALLTYHLFFIGEEILKKYQNLKDQAEALDFDDLILRALDLLEGKTNNMSGLDVAPWIRYKLDQGIDHLLVDEAQDTNPEQWKIIEALTDDFFDNMVEEETQRSLFVVGDQKQSIFSFQRASPEKFSDMQHWFQQKIHDTAKKFETINFNVSFRSVKSVLALVDEVFSPPEIQKGVDIDPIQHTPYRYTQAGLVELWPLFETQEKEAFDPWNPPITTNESSSGATQMATNIGETIAKWLNTKEVLSSYNRPIKAGDIMILVRSRTAFIDQLVRALKIRNIAVSGVDRMVLSDQLVVQDLCACAQFALLPEDDLILACLLKSPFIGLSEEDLFDLCYDRGAQSLWSVVKEKNDNSIKEWLKNLIQAGGKTAPYEFFSSLLQTQCPTKSSGLKAIKSRLGDESLDPLDEFLNKALAFEKENIPTLQTFIQAQLHNESQIKRQTEEGSNAVRIMTVHAAKGLQAPIVILPDTTRTAGSVKPERILWPDKTGGELPYFCPTSTNLPDVIQNASTHLKSKLDEEYRRLLYVALTRAEERLYIGGYKGSKNISNECWYNYIHNAFQNLPNTQTILENDKEILRYTNPATDKPDRTDKNQKETLKKIKDAPSWIFEKIKEEPFPPRPLTPSRPSESETPTLSPLRAGENYRFLRGNITHKLLQILPDIAPEKRKEAAQAYVQQPLHNISKKIQDSIVSETLKILNNPNFSAIFGTNSMAEVPVTGLIDNKTLISGQIDRLLVTDQEVLIIDYKTNRPPPAEVKDVPTIYKKQMIAYANIMRYIYPNHIIRGALIWTDGARLMEIPDI